jgi:hypothetical protein
MLASMFRKSILGLGATLLAGGVPALAQVTVSPPPATSPPVTTTILPGRVIPPVAIMPARITGDSSIRVGSPGARTGATGEISTAASSPIAPVSALSMFLVGFQNGDHKFNRLAVLPNGATALVAFADQNRDDPFRTEARWVNFEGGLAGSVSGFGSGSYDLAIPAGPANHTLVLRGFELRRKDRTDANVRQMGVQLLQDRKVARVTLVDDQGPDFRGVGGIMIPAIIAGLGVTTAEIIEASQRLSEARGPLRPFAARVDYAWIPNSLVETRGVVTGSESGREAARIPGRAVVQGFEATFGNSDHHLLVVGVDTSSGGSVSFQDNDRNDPMRYRLDYVALRDAGADARGPSVPETIRR